MKRRLSIIAVTSCLLAACASLPPQFEGETLSTADQNIVITAATIRQNLPTAEVVIETAAPLLLAELAKQPATQQRDGLLLFEVGNGLAGVGGATPVSTSIVASTAAGLNTSLSTPTDNVIQAVVSDAQAPINAEITQLNDLANSATNPDVKAYVLATIPLVVNGVGVALETSFGSYAPTPEQSAMIAQRKEYIARIRLHAKEVFYVMGNDPDMTTAALRRYLHD